jgi:hypothetical protein
MNLWHSLSQSDKERFLKIEMAIEQALKEKPELTRGNKVFNDFVWVVGKMRELIVASEKEAGPQ